MPVDESSGELAGPPHGGSAEANAPSRPEVPVALLSIIVQ